MFNLSNAFTIFTFLGILVVLVGRSETEQVVTGGIRIKYPYIKISILTPTSEASSLNI